MLFLLVFEVFYYVLFNMYLIFPLIINFRNCVDNHRYYCQFQSPEELRLAINNLSKADPELHETRFDIEPHTGMAIQFHKQMQVSQSYFLILLLIQLPSFLLIFSFFLV